ncbi:MAG: SDR family oxidoreductase [Gemmatimonadales bacterium]
MDLKIDGKVALVCGSSLGLGRAIAVAFAEEGCRIALNGRDQERLDAAVELVGRHASGDVRGFAADVSAAEQATHLVERVQHELGSVDILVCNAGGPAAAAFRDTPAENWQAALELNLLSTVHLCRAAVPVMQRQAWGRIVCLTSVAAKQPLPGLILSSTARAGVLGFAKSLADEVAVDGITVNVVCPGYMHTERIDELVEQRAADTGRSPREVLVSMIGDIPIGRMGEPEELAAAIAFLASEPARYITGAVLQVDGGFIRSIV